MRSRVNQTGHLDDRSELAPGLLRLLAVAEAGSFAAAARSLGISRQAVHRSVEGLEAAVGGPLLDRGPRAVRPTPLGRDLLVQAVRLREVERSVRAAISRARREPSGTVRVTAPPVFADTVLADALVAFAATWPSVRVVARAESRRTDLVADDHDLMIRIGAAPPEDSHAVRLGVASVVRCASPSYLARVGPVERPSDLDGLDALEYGPPRPGEPPPRIQSESAAVVVAACLAGLGVLRCPELAVARHLARGALVRVLPEDPLPSPEVWAVYAHRTADDPTLAELVRALRSAFERG